MFVIREEHSEMWKRSATILELSAMEATRFYGLTVLQEAIETRWQVIPLDQRLGKILIFTHTQL